MHPTCEVCGSAPNDGGAESVADADGRAPAAGPPDAAVLEARLRGHLFQELDLLAFALEMEVAEALEQGDEAAAARNQQTRLGIRLAQRLVGGVSAPEVDRRIDRWRAEYEAKFPT